MKSNLVSLHMVNKLDSVNRYEFIYHSQLPFFMKVHTVSRMG